MGVKMESPEETKKRYLNDQYAYLVEHLEFWMEEEQKKLDTQYIPDTEEYENLTAGYRAAVVQGFNAAAEAFTEYLKKEYTEELRRRNADRFPLVWMEKPRIKAATKRCPSFYPILNYLFKRNQYWRGSDLHRMVEQADKLTKGSRYLSRDKNYYSTFQGNDDFYTELNNHTKVSKSTCKRYIAAFVKMGILKVLYKGRNDGYLYTDGYFAPYMGDKIRKHTFLKKDPLIIEKLKELPELVNTYGKGKTPAHSK
jgi:hypothetical protein